MSVGRTMQSVLHERPAGRIGRPAGARRPAHRFRRPRFDRETVGSRWVLPSALLAVVAPSYALASPADEVLQRLQAADQARQSDATEAQQWAEEKARLELLLTSIEERIRSAKQRQTVTQEALQTERAARPPSTLVQFETGALRVASDIHRALDHLAMRVPPGLIPARGPQRADPREALDQALHRLERTERGLTSVDVSIAPGRLNGEAKSVEVLRLGGVAAWWRSLDGTTGGEAHKVDGEFRLVEQTDPAVLDAIARASAIAKGRRAPEVLLLPVRFARTSTKGQLVNDPLMRATCRRVSVSLVMLVVGTGGLPSAAGQSNTASQLVRAAQRKQSEAEDRLASRRRTRLAARARLTRRLQEAYARLAAAEQAAEQTEATLAAERRATQLEAPNRARAEQRRQNLVRLLGQAANLMPDERSDDASAFLSAVHDGLRHRLTTLDRDTRIQVREGPVLGRDGREANARIVRVGSVAGLAVGASANATGFLRTERDAPPIVVGGPLSTAAVRALEEAVPGSGGRLPFDVDGALTRIEAEPPDVSAGLKAGGIFVWPILAVGLLGLLLFSERLYYFVLRPAKAENIGAVIEALRHRDPEAARTIVTPSRTDLDRVLAAGIETFDRPQTTREQALETALLREEPALERGVSLLGAVAGLAPLLGLLGTVTGMITTFDVISTFGTGNPQLLSGGISVALITTQLGLIVAVPALLAHAWVSRAAAKRAALLEEARTTVLSIASVDGAA